MTYRNPPGPKGLPFLGSLPDYARDPLGFLQSLADTYGDIAHFTAGPEHFYLLNHPDLIHEALVEKPEQFQKEQIDKIVLGRFLGNGLLLNDGETWKRQRRLVQPRFHTRRIQAYAQVMVDRAVDLMTGWQDGGSLDISHEMTRVTLAIVAKTLFDAEVEGDTATISDALTEGQNIAVRQIRLGIPFPEWLPLPINRRQRRVRAELDAVILRMIRQRRTSQEDRGDLLSMLLLAQDEADGTGMTDEQVRDEVATLFVAGHETTATALTWIWYLLSQHNEVERRLCDELTRVLKGRPPTFADLTQLVYTEMIVKEAMRLYPPAWLFGRQPIGMVTIGDYPLIQGSTVLISPYVMHHHRLYFENPIRFEPERFSSENEKRLPKYAYIPFGGGPRICIGNSFAMMEAKLILATIAQRFQLILSAKQKIDLEPLVTLRPKDGIQMLLKQRELGQLENEQEERNDVHHSSES